MPVLSHPGLRAAVAIALGAIAGALSRYYITLWLAQKLGTAFPYGTVCVNLVGAFIMGGFIVLVREWGGISPELALLVSVGFLGSLTTFSTYALDTANLMRDRTLLLALFYWAGSALLGLVSLYAGMGLVRRLLS